MMARRKGYARNRVFSAPEALSVINCPSANPRSFRPNKSKEQWTMTLVNVMAGLVAAIHVFDLAPDSRRGCPAQGRA